MLPIGLPKKTLAWDAMNWASLNLAQPDGKRKGQPWIFTKEQALFLAWWYAIDDYGQFIYRSGVIELPKGAGKSPFLAAIACIEFQGPCRFSRWDDQGNPIAVKANTPLVQIAAISDSQAENSYQPCREMMLEGSFRRQYPEVEVMLAKTIAPGGRKLEKVTASPRGREGNRATFILMDEALALDTPVPTPNGWTVVSDLKVGDQVIGIDGTPADVIKLTEIMEERSCFRADLSDRTSVVTSSGHLWWAKPNGCKPRIMTSQQIYDSPVKVLIPGTPEVQYEAKDLPIPPYAFGAWLGDGTSHDASITVGNSDLDAMCKTLTQDGDLEITVRPYHSDHAYTVGLSLPGTKYKSTGFKQKLRDLEVYKNKHIPAIYLRASIEQRYALLQGLMDTDGSAHKGGASSCYSGINKRLIEDVAELARSLGFKATVSTTKNHHWGEMHWVTFAATKRCFRLERKQKNAREQRPARWQRIKMSPVDSVPVKCVTINRDDHILLVGRGYTPTRQTANWVPADKGPELFEALSRNVAKMNCRWIATTNAHIPGEGSVAEMHYNTYEMQCNGDRDYHMLFWRKTADLSDEDFFDDVKLEASLRRLYESAVEEKGGWINIPNLIKEIRAPHTRPDVAKRYYLNQHLYGTATWLRKNDWEACKRSGLVLKKSDKIAIGFHGKVRHGSVAIVACRLTDGALFNLGWWETKAEDDELNYREVDRRMRKVLDTYACFKVLANPDGGFQDIIGKWAVQYNDDKHSYIEEFWARQKSKMAKAVEQFEEAVYAHRVSYNDDNFSRHVLACHIEEVPDGYILRKETTYSSRFINGAQAAVLAFEAREQALADGALENPDNTLRSF